MVIIIVMISPSLSLNKYIYTHMYKCIYTHTYTHTHTYIHIYTHIYTHVYTHTHTYIHTHIYTHIHIYIYTHTHRNKYTQTRSLYLLSIRQYDGQHAVLEAVVVEYVCEGGGDHALDAEVAQGPGGMLSGGQRVGG